MHDFPALLKADRGQPATTLHLVDKDSLDAWMAAQPDRVRQALGAQSFKGKGFDIGIVPGEGSSGWSAVLGVADAKSLGVWCLARAAEVLPEGTYRLAFETLGPAALGWLLAQYRYGRYRSDDHPAGPRVLLTNDPARIDETILLAESTSLVRDLVNTPANDLGPQQLEQAARELASECSVSANVIVGKELDEGYPLIAAVGNGATEDRAPRLVEFKWGDQRHPRVAIIGKGVVFDSGGLDIKPGSGMRLMKKDMGGAAHALGLARLIMKANLPVRLHLLVPIVENAVSGAAFRPGDVIRSRKGLTVEIDNTDAEGRLILADALTRAAEEEPELIVDFATLTGAARVALGPDLPALFSNEDDLAAELQSFGNAVVDPVWRMPLWAPYADMLSSDIADVSNAADAPMAGAVTAALFLEKFVPSKTPWVHFDTFAWRSSAKPGRPKGGDAIGMRAAWETLKSRYRR